MATEGEGTTHFGEHLANERTYLAWLRTSVALISLGIAINRLALYLLQNRPGSESEGTGSLRNIGVDAEWMGTGFVAFGLLLLVLSAVNYRKRSREIETRTFQPMSVSITLITGLVLLLGMFGLAWFHLA